MKKSLLFLAPALIFSLVGCGGSGGDSQNPSVNPSVNPSLNPSVNPSLNPSVNPSLNPSVEPSVNPSQEEPSTAPSGEVTVEQFRTIGESLLGTNPYAKAYTHTVLNMGGQEMSEDVEWNYNFDNHTWTPTSAASDTPNLNEGNIYYYANSYIETQAATYSTITCHVNPYYSTSSGSRQGMAFESDSRWNEYGEPEYIYSSASVGYQMSITTTVTYGN